MSLSSDPMPESSTPVIGANAVPLAGEAAAFAASHPSSGGAREPRRYILLLALANLGVCTAVITPVLASMAFKLQHITADPAAATGQLGTILGLGALFALITNPIVGRLSDRTTARIGMRRPWLIGGAVVGLISLIGVGLATSPVLVALFWFITQAALNAVIAAETATVADQVPANRRGRVSAVFGITIPLSILLGTFLVSVLTTDLLRFAVPGAISLVLVAIFAIGLPDRVQTVKPGGRLTVRELAGSFYFSPRQNPDFGWTWLSKFGVAFGYAGVATFFPLFLASKFGFNEAQTLQVIVTANLILTVMTVLSAPIAGYISDRLNRRRLFVALAGLIQVVGLIILAFAPNLPVIYIAEAIIGLGVGSFTSVDLALGTQVITKESNVAKDLGILNTANSLPQSVAPLIAPLVIGVFALTPIGGYSGWYVFGAIISAIGALLVWRVRSVR